MSSDDPLCIKEDHLSFLNKKILAHFDEIMSKHKQRSLSVLRESSDVRELHRAQAELDLIDDITRDFTEDRNVSYEYRELR